MTLPYFPALMQVVLARPRELVNDEICEQLRVLAGWNGADRHYLMSEIDLLDAAEKLDPAVTVTATKTVTAAMDKLTGRR